LLRRDFQQSHADILPFGVVHVDGAQSI